MAGEATLWGAGRQGIAEERLRDYPVLSTIGKPMSASILITVVTFVSINAAAVGCERMPNAQEARLYQGWGFDVRLPASTTVAAKRPVEDFELYEFRSNDKLILKAYAGNHSRFGESASRDVVRSSEQIGGAQADRLEWRDSGGRLYVEVQLTLNRSIERPRQIHFSFDGLTSEEKEVAELIIRSARPSTAR